MATSFYPKALEKFARGQVNWDADDIAAVLVDSGAYTYNVAHEFLSDIPAAARISGIATLAGKTSVGGALDAEDTQFPSVTGTSIEVILIFKRGGSEATSPLLLYIDQGTGLPITPNGGDIRVNWDEGTFKIARL